MYNKVVGALTLFLVNGCKTFRLASFNCLAPIHKSVDEDESFDLREGDDQELWLPRALDLVSFIADALKGVDVICLQEWWFDRTWVDLFEEACGEEYTIISARRKGRHPHNGSPRSDGLATLVSRSLEINRMRNIDLSTGRVALAQEVTGPGLPKIVVANMHAPFPYDETSRQQQLEHAGCVASVVESMTPDFAIIAGDLNSGGEEPPAKLLTNNFGYLNCGAADDIITHRTHLGDDVQCDHIFVKQCNDNFSSMPQIRNRLLSNIEFDRFDFPCSYSGWCPAFGVSDHIPVMVDIDLHTAHTPSFLEARNHTSSLDKLRGRWSKKHQAACDEVKATRSLLRSGSPPCGGTDLISSDCVRSEAPCSSACHKEDHVTATKNDEPAL